MTQIFSELGNTPHEFIKETIEDPGLDFLQAKDAAKKLALTKCKNCMVLSWKMAKQVSFTQPGSVAHKTSQPGFIMHK